MSTRKRGHTRSHVNPSKKAGNTRDRQNTKAMHAKLMLNVNAKAKAGRGMERRTVAFHVSRLKYTAAPARNESLSKRVKRPAQAQPKKSKGRGMQRRRRWPRSTQGHALPNQRKGRLKGKGGPSRRRWPTQPRPGGRSAHKI